MKRFFLEIVLMLLGILLVGFLFTVISNSVFLLEVSKEDNVGFVGITMFILFGYILYERLILAVGAERLDAKEDPQVHVIFKPDFMSVLWTIALVILYFSFHEDVDTWYGLVWGDGDSAFDWFVPHLFLIILGFLVAYVVRRIIPARKPE